MWGGGPCDGWSHEKKYVVYIFMYIYIYCTYNILYIQDERKMVASLISNHFAWQEEEVNAYLLIKAHANTKNGK